MAEHADPAAVAQAAMPEPDSASGRATAIAAMERLVTRVAEGSDATDGRTGSEYLLFTCDQTPCAVPLVELREVLPTLPAPVPLPFSPPWFLGVFPLRLDVLGLVDPAPLLLGTNAPSPRIGATATAIVAGDDTLLALAVSSVGDIVVMQPDEITTTHAGGLSTVAESYALGACVPRAGGAYTLIDMHRLIDDLVRALTEVAGDE